MLSRSIRGTVSRTLRCRYFSQARPSLTADNDDSGIENEDTVPDLYKPNPVTEQRSESEVESYRKEHGITIIGENFKPLLTVEELGVFPPKCERVFRAKNFQLPTPIQAHVWPAALAGRDLVGVAQTGSGKTLGYLLPTAVHAAERIAQGIGGRSNGPLALVLAPTRELVQQITDVGEEWCRGAFGLRVTPVYGGVSRTPQIQRLERGTAICVATPGRLLDLLESRDTGLANCRTVVLDEADRMLDMGFEPQLRQIVRQLPKSIRQTLMFSATWPKEIRALAEEFLREPFIRVNVGSVELCANSNIRQVVRVVDSREKDDKLVELLEKEMASDHKALIFAATQARVERLTRLLRTRGFNGVQMTHGGLSQARRGFALERFQMPATARGAARYLIATDVAARGLDVPDINWVVNYDCPGNGVDYVHRIGRTGRGLNPSATSVSVTFLTDENTTQALEIIDVLKQAGQDVPGEVENLAAMSPKNKAQQQRRRPNNISSFYAGTRPSRSGDKWSRHNEFDAGRKQQQRYPRNASLSREHEHDDDDFDDDAGYESRGSSRQRRFSSGSRSYTDDSFDDYKKHRGKW